MYYEPELQLICNTLRRCGISVRLIQPEELAGWLWSVGPSRFFMEQEGFIKSLGEKLESLSEATVYQLTDMFSCRHLYYKLPDLGQEKVMVVGPYLTEQVTFGKIAEGAEKLGVSPQWTRQVEKYYNSIPAMGQGSQLFVMLDAFFERIWGAGGYTMEEHNQETAVKDLTLPSRDADKEENRLWNMEMMEMRYGRENELMEAVASGQYHKIEVLFSQFSASNFEQRLSDSIRNTKNYCIITNTLFRKAAENGGVHPYYIDELSSDFARRIEITATEKEAIALIAEMARAYCRMVRKRNMKNYSGLITKATLHIESDLAGHLSLNALARALNVNASYLSALFKKETGVTVTEYVAQRRMELAKQLLKDTRLQVQTVAQHCGIEDVPYFTKLFKRYTGVTPREYRQT